MPIPQLTLEDFEHRFAGRHRLQDIVATWASRKPEAAAVINADRGTVLTWHDLETQSAVIARGLGQMGLGKGDYLVTSLPLLIEHIVLEFACFRLGVIVAPLDLRLSPAEVIRSIGVLGAKAFVFLGQTPLADFRPLGQMIAEKCPTVQHRIQLSPPEECIEGALPFVSFATGGADVRDNVQENDPALVIFTTGSTGSPKPALLSHRNIACQSMCLSQAFFDGDSGARTLVNLPPSHVGCQTELMMGTLFGGGTAVILETFDPTRSLRAIERYKVNKIGQIPAMFHFEWRLKEYSEFDLTSLDFVAYGGQQVTRAFLEKMATMAPRIASGLGLTESAGFCTYILKPAADPGAILGTLGESMPVYPFSIREAMRDDGIAGDELEEGKIGHVCFRGPQTFLGYVGDPETTARTISTDGWLYTGDLGLRDGKNLRLTGRAKWVIKSAGYQVFPGDIEEHISALADKVASCAVVGAEHDTLGEGIVAFVEKQPGVELSAADLERHSRGLASYTRPRHWVLMEAGQMPLTRTVKADYVRLSQMAKDEVQRLRDQGKWDRR